MTGLSWWKRLALWALGFGPAAWIVALAITGRLGANPIAAVLHRTGDWTLNFLMLVFLLGPLQRKAKGSMPLHQVAGRFAALYAVLHLSIYVGLDHFFDIKEMWQDVLKHKRIIAGLGALLVLVVQFFTSLKVAVRRLGHARFVWLHRLVWAGGALGVFHYVLLVKKDIRIPLVYAAIFGTLALARLIFFRRPRAASTSPPG